MLEQELQIIKGQNLIFSPATNPLAPCETATSQTLSDEIQQLSANFRTAAECLTSKSVRTEITNYVLRHPWMAVVMPENLRSCHYGIDAVLFVGPETSEFDSENPKDQPILKGKELKVSFGQVAHTIEFLNRPPSLTRLIGLYPYLYSTTDITYHLSIAEYETEQRLYMLTLLSADIRGLVPLPLSCFIEHGILVIPTKGLKQELGAKYGRDYGLPNYLSPTVYVTAIENIGFEIWRETTCRRPRDFS
jgi:hypothetical protein